MILNIYNLEEINLKIEQTINGSFLLENDKPIDTLILPEGIKEIECFTFYGIRNLKKVVLPKSLERISLKAFAYSHLEEVEFNNNLRIIADKAFCCTHLKKIVLPENLEALQVGCFGHCKNLEEVTFTGKSVFMESYIFADCCNLKKITLPENLRILPAYTFSNCFNLKEINFKNIEYIGSSVFINCVNLEKLIVKDNVKELYPNFFEIDEQLIPKEFKNKSSKLKLYIDKNHKSSKKLLKNKNLEIVEVSSLDNLLNEGKTFKEINILYKDSERIK